MGAAPARCLSRRALGTLALAALAVAPLACASEPPAAPPVLDIAAACAEYADAHETAAQCTRADIVPAGQWQVPLPPAQARTRRLFEERCRTWLGAPGSGITPAVLHACSVHIRRLCINGYYGAGVFSRARGEWGSALSLCELDIPGTLPDGAACGDSSQCAGGLCDKSYAWGTYAPACGTCVSRSPVGELCVPYGCAAGGVCPGCKGEGCSVGFRCVPAPRAAEGEDCTRYPCAPGLRCDEMTTRTCTAPGLPGAACREHSYCRFGWCEDGVCSDQRGEGGKCSDSLQCRPGLACERSVCVPPTAPEWEGVPLGGTCDNGRDAFRCREGECRGSTCVARARLGEPCDGDSSCVDRPFLECLDGRCQLFDPGACR